MEPDDAVVTGPLLDPDGRSRDAATMDAGTPCAACAALVSAEDLAQGFAVRVGGRLLCPLCIDRLPGDAQIKVNQMRALRGMLTRTYRVASPRHVGLALFSFTTSALVLAHLRHRVRGEEFATPPLPPPASRPRLPSAAEAGRGDHRGWIIAAALALLVVVALVWLIAGSTAPRRPRDPTPAPVPVAGPPPPLPSADPPPAASPARALALRLTALENRLHDHPASAAEVQRAAEQLRDELPPAESMLRSRADALASEAAMRIPRPIEPPKPVADPVQPLEPPKAPVEPPKPPVAAVVAPPEPSPVAKPVKPHVAAKPEPRPWAPASWPVAPRDPCRADPAKEDLPWPWPVGADDDALLHAQPQRGSRKRMQLELALTGVGADGGVVLCLHPGRRDRSLLSAAWSDGTTSVELPPIRLAPQWQSVALPAPDPALARASLRLVLADAADLDREQPFLAGPGWIVPGAMPRAEDFPPPLPVIAPDPATANGNAFRRAFGERLDRVRGARHGRFDEHALGILIAGMSSDADHAVRLAFQERLGIAANPGELPLGAADLADPARPWPGKLEDAVDNRWQTLLFGAGEQAWGAPDELSGKVSGLLLKMNATARPRAHAALPVLVVGSPDFASAEDQRRIDALWTPIIALCAPSGVPVIDLRPAQRAEHAAARRERAATLLAEGWRQIAVLITRMRN